MVVWLSAGDEQGECMYQNAPLTVPYLHRHTPTLALQYSLPYDNATLPLPPMPRPQYVINMGMTGSYQFHDVFGLDPELLAMIPQPVLAVLLLFPITDNVSEPQASFSMLPTFCNKRWSLWTPDVLYAVCCLRHSVLLSHADLV